MASNENCQDDILRIIEEKRRQAIELRKRRQENNQNSPEKRLNINSTEYGTTKQNVQILKKNSSVASDKRIEPFNNFTDIIDRSSSVQNNVIKTTSDQNKPKKDYDSRKLIEIKIELQSSNRFYIKSPYDTDLNKIYRSVNSKQWDPITKIWSFSLEDFSGIFKQFKLLKHLNIKLVDSISEEMINRLIEANNNAKKVIDLKEKLDTSFIEQLFEFQKVGIMFGIRQNGRCLIADDMGLGKTIQAIGLAKWYQDDWPLLIVCPSSLRYQWMQSLRRWIKDLKEKDIFIVVNTKDSFPKVPITIISYDLIARLKDRFLPGTNSYYQMIILDESQQIKSDTAQRTSITGSIARTCKRAILLSGTPALSRPIELYPQLNILDKNFFSSKHAFGLRYCDAKQKTFFKMGKPVTSWDYNGATNLGELRIILENTLMIRRLKVDVLDQLPRKKREMVLLDSNCIPDKEKSQLKAIRNQIIGTKNKSDQLGLLFSWFSKSSAAKIPCVIKYIRDMLDTDTKFILFCHHKAMLDGVEDMLNKEKVNHIRIDGNTPAKIRQEACEIFQTKPNFKIALLSLMACYAGLNLTAATVVVFAEAYWNPGVLTQAEDRAHRIGQEFGVKVIYLVTKDTSDEYIWPLINKKLEVLNKAGLSREDFSKTYNPLDKEADQALIDEFLKQLNSEKE